MTSRLRSPTYHGRVLEGIEILEELHGQEIAKEFREDFMENSYENPVPGNSFAEETPEKDKNS